MGAEQEGEHPTGIAVVHLLLLAGFQRGQALGSQRAWVDAEIWALRFPDIKTGVQVRPIDRAALDLIRAQPRREGSPFVFPSDAGRPFHGRGPVLERA